MDPRGPNGFRRRSFRELGSVYTNGANERQLTFDKRFHNNPAVCEGVRSVVYDTDFEGTVHLWKLELEGGATSKLTNGRGEASAVCPGAGDRLLFAGQVADGRTRLYKMSTSGGTPEQVGEWTVLPASVPAASLDGKHLAFAVAKNGETRGSR